jgi:hypothetical protein
MPTVTEHTEPKKRRAPWWVLVFAMMLLSLAGLFGWSLFRPVIIELGPRVLVLHRLPSSGMPLHLEWHGGMWDGSFDLPAGFARYEVFWVRKSN